MVFDSFVQNFVNSDFSSTGFLCAGRDRKAAPVMMASDGVGRKRAGGHD